MSRFQPIQSKYYSGFSPLQIGDCALWLDAGDSSTITLSGSNVTAWADKSGNSRNTSAVFGTPVLSNNSVISRQGVYFNGTSYFTGPFSYSSNTLSWFIVGTVESDGEAFGRLLSLGASGQFDFDSALRMNALCRESNTTELVSFRNAYIARNMNITYGRPFVTSSIINGTSNFPFLYGTPATGAATSTNFGFTTYGISGSFGANIQRNKGFIFEVLIYTGALTTIERQQVEGYLAWKWLGSGQVSSITSFLPTQISGCTFWLDAADSTTVTLSGSNVTQWNDKSGNGYNATQGTAGQRPTYSNRGVYFNAAASNNMAISVPYPNNFTMFLVASSTAASGAYYLGRAQFGGGGPTLIANFTGSSIEYYNAADRATFAATPTSTFLISYTQQLGGRIVGFYNGASAFDIAQTNNVNPGVAWSTLGNSYLTSYNNYLTGFIYEILIYNTALTTTQRQQVENYLTSKWNISRLGLPTTHPYSSILPISRPFQPLDAGGCVLWLDGADPSTITLSGSNVTQWADKSGNGNTASTFAGTITYSSNSLVFSGTEMMNTPLTSVLNNQTVFCVVSYNASTAVQNVISFRHTGTQTQLPGYSTRLSNRQQNVTMWGGTVIVNGATITTTTPFLYGAIFRAGSSSFLFSNGTQTGTTSSTVSPTGTGTIAIGNYGDPPILGSGAGGEPLNGRIYEVLLYNDILSSNQRQQVEGYLARKWGFQGSLSTLTAFSPTQISNCALWLDAADSSTFTLSGTDVSQWRDKSGSNNHMNQYSAGTAPSTSTLNGYSTVFFNTADPTSAQYTEPFTNIKVLRGTNFQTTSNSTVFLVATPLYTSTNTRFIVNLKSRNASAWANLYDWTFGTGGGGGSSYVRTDTTSVGADNSYYVSNTTSLTAVQVTGTSVAFYNNGSVYSSGTLSLPMPASDAFQVFTMGGYLNTDPYDFVSKQGARVHFNEVLIYNGSLTTQERQQVEGYLARKWGLAGSLPSGHPFALTSLPLTHPFRSRLPMSTIFNPRQISNCALWLDAADLPTLTLSGSNVATWLDKSGNGRNTSTFCNAPTFSNRAVRFSTNQGLAVNLSASSATESGFVVCGFTNYSLASTLLGSSNGSGGRQFRVSEGIIQTVRQDIAGVLFSGTGLSLNTTQLVEYVNNGTTLTHYWNGTTYASGSTAAYTSGRTTSIGYRWGPFEPLNGYIQEILVYDRAVSTEERRQIEGYLAWKWGFETPLTQTLTSFLPTYIPNCILWLDAGDSSTLTLSGSNVTQWNDKSGTSNNAVTSSRFPWLGPTITSSNSLRFTRVAGTSVQMLRTQTGRQTTTDVTYIVVVKPSNDAAGGTYFDLRKATNGQALVNLSSNAASYRGSTSSLYSFAIPASTSAFNVITLQAGTNRYAAYLNGNIIGSGTSTLDMPASDAAYTTIGAATDLNFSAGATSNNQINFTQTSEFYEIVMFNSYLTLAQIQQVEAYLASKWNLSIRSLPSTHPYARINPAMSTYSTLIVTYVWYGSANGSAGGNATGTFLNIYNSGASSITLNNTTFGDPQPGVAKSTWINYTKQGVSYSVGPYPEGTVLLFTSL